MNYTFEIILVDELARCMEVVYKSENRQTMHVGARLPFEGESLENIIKMYAPVPYWREKELSVVVPQVGMTGSLSVEDSIKPPIEEVIRSNRNIALSLSDWTVLSDAPLDPTTQAAWIEYRRLLRDIPQQSGFPDNVVWPTVPV